MILSRPVAPPPLRYKTGRLGDSRLGWASAPIQCAGTVKAESATCFVQLGRYGDILCILPILQRHAEQHGRPALMVSSQFADILDGVSYVAPEVYGGEFWELHRAVETAKRKYSKVIPTQAWWRDGHAEAKCQSYSEELWRLAGCLEEYENPAWRLVIDRRSPEREARLCERYCACGKPIVCVSLAGGHSSQFPHWRAVQAAITGQWSEQFEIIDLSRIQADRPYDLLGLLENAALLVTSDTMPLWLAGACNVPVAAFLSEQGSWRQSKPRCRCVAVMSAGPGQGWEEQLHEVIYHIWRKWRLGPTMFHAHETHLNLSERELRASASWERFYGRNLCDCGLKSYPRNATCLGDRRSLPFLKDALRQAEAGAEPHDIVILTNSDSFLVDGVLEAVSEACSKWGACFSQRIDVVGSIQATQQGIPSYRTKAHCGRDMFAFRVAWLRQHWAAIPDFALGTSDWDFGVACLIRRMLGQHVAVKNRWYDVLDMLSPKLGDIMPGYLLHEYHAAVWHSAEHQNRSPAQTYNRSLLAGLLSSMDPELIIGW